jgi:homoserine O-acetyltransferase/O-succinyltransferase
MARTLNLKRQPAVAEQPVPVLAPGVRLAALPDPFRLFRGGELHGASIAYECWGELDAERSNAILLFTGLSPPPHAASTPANRAEGWWERMIGPGRAIDTERYFVVCVNSLGSCFGSTGPASINPATGLPYRLDFPEIAVEDIARAGHEVVKSLGISRLAAVMGPSLGGMVATAFAAVCPGAARRLVSISGSPGASAFAIALRSLQREAVMSDPDWKGGQYDSVATGPRNGMRLARKLGTITYRSAAEWKIRFGRSAPGPNGQAAAQGATDRVPAGFGPRFSVESYLEAQAQRFISIFDPNCYLYLSRAMDCFDLEAHGTPGEVMRRAGIESALVIGVESDLLFAIDEQAAIAQALSDGGVPTRFARLPSIEGHDAFLVDLPRFDAAIRGFLETT